jgi:indole-3-acetate monooxygenase
MATPEAHLSRAAGHDYLARVATVAPVLKQALTTIDAERKLPADVLDALHSEGLFRLSLTAKLNGDELAPYQLAEVTEAVAAIDASTAWCLGQGFGCAMSAAFLGDDAATQVFGPRDAVLAWGAGVQGTATLTDGGYQVSGTWRFASGGKHATWLGAHCKLVSADGAPVLDSDGRPRNRTALIPRSHAQMADDWHVLGLRGTRSEGYTFTDEFVPQALTLDREDLSSCRSEAPLYMFPTTNVYATVFSGVALGVARGALDDLLALAMHKRQRGARSSMRDSAVFQTRIAELEGMWSSAKSFHSTVARQTYAEVASGVALNLEMRARIRLSTTWAINQARDVVGEVYSLAGSTAIFDAEPFERRFRDINAVSQQVQGRQSNFETVGRYMLGHDADTLFM